MASLILDAGALPQAVLDSCHRPTQRRGGVNGPSWKDSQGVGVGARGEWEVIMMEGGMI
jgi:hypothetical protein